MSKRKMHHIDDGLPDILMSGWEQLLADLYLMVDPYSGGYAKIPVPYQNALKAWCEEIKQQDWQGNWDRAWINYHHEFLQYVIDAYLGFHGHGDLIEEKPYVPPYAED